MRKLSYEPHRHNWKKRLPGAVAVGHTYFVACNKHQSMTNSNMAKSNSIQSFFFILHIYGLVSVGCVPVG